MFIWLAGTFNPSLFFRFTVYFLSACVSHLLVFPICLCIPSPYVSCLLMYPVCLCILSPYVSHLLMYPVCLCILSACVPVYLCFYFLFFYFLFFPERQKYLQKAKIKRQKHLQKRNKIACKTVKIYLLRYPQSKGRKML